MSCLELVAVVFGLAGVYLGIRESVWNWPVGMVNVALYAVLFYGQRLPSNALLQVVYFGLSAYGWYQWLYGGANRTPLTVARASARTWLGATIAGVIIWVTLIVATRSAGGAMPVLDAGTAAASLVAEWMLARKLLDNWALWIAVDSIYVAMFVSQGLFLTAVNYAVYVVLAVMGLVAWKRLLAHAASPAAAA